MRFRIDLKIFIFLILFYFTKQIELYATIMFFCIIHELGHLISGILLGMKPEKLELMPFGLSVSFKLYPKDYNKKIGKSNLLEIKKILVAIAGPLTNLVIIFIIKNIDVNFLSNKICIYANLLIMLFNLIPIYPLDGGRILKGVLSLKFGKKKAREYSNNISNLFIIILTVISSIAIYYFKNIAIFVIIIFLWLLVIKENKIHRQMIEAYEIIERGGP